MKIDRHLNLVIPIQTEKHGTVYAHSVPISRDVFEQFYLELGKVFNQCFDGGNETHMALTAPQIAYPALKALAKKSGSWDEVKKGLVNEIIRLTNVMIAGDRGWETIPLDSAIKREMIDEDEEAEILSGVIFFTAISKVAPKDLRISFLQMAGSLRNWELLSLDSTAFKNSLPTLTKVESTGAMVPVSSIIA
jgi:hypothetical protein